jgi:membrane protease YdiL (CAAX protease family)
MSIAAMSWTMIAAPRVAPMAPAPSTAPANASSSAGITILLVVLTLTALSLALMVGLRLYRARAIVGPSRLQTRQGGGLLFAFIIGAMVWFGSQIVVFGVYQSRWETAGHRTVMKEADLTPRQIAVLSTVPPVAGFAALIAADLLFLGACGVSQLGFKRRRAVRFISIGAVAFAIIYPWVCWMMIASEAVFRFIEFHHPDQHELLLTLHATQDNTARFLIILGATLLAPFFEELFFRAHLQTLIRKAVEMAIFRARPQRGPGGSAAGWAAPPSALGASGATGFPAIVPPPPPPNVPQVPAPTIPRAQGAAEWASPALPPAALDGTDAEARLQARRSSSPLAAWIAVIVTALLFASVHEAWSSPAIFVLAIGLGFTYERTGNLWSNITIHILFNAVNTAQSLAFK